MDKKLEFHMSNHNIIFSKPIDYSNYGSVQRDKEYWLIMHSSSAATYGNWKTGEQYNYFNQRFYSLSTEQKNHVRDKAKAIRSKRHNELLKRQEETARKAQEVYSKSSSEGFSWYLKNKKLEGLKMKYHNQNLIIPMYDINGKIWNLQTIYCNGIKRYEKGKVQELFYIFDFPRFIKSKKAFIAEGVATCASIYLATNIPTICCFNAGNIKPVLKKIVSKYPKTEPIIASDDDAYGDVNIGIEKAREASKLFCLKAYIPQFSNRSTKPTDFNDLHCLEGLEAVTQQLSGV